MIDNKLTILKIDYEQIMIDKLTNIDTDELTIG